MDPETLPKPEPTSPAPHRSRWRRVLAVGAGVAMVPALYAVSSAATGGGLSPSTVAAHSRSADDAGTEVEVEHGVEVEKPHGGAPTPSVPEATTPTTPEATTPTTPTTPVVTTPEAEHPVPEPGDDHGVDDDDNGTPVTPAPATTQSFSSVGGSITVSGDGSTISLASSTPATGFTTEVHDNGPNRVEVRFSSGGTEWRIRVELVGGGALTSEVTQHG